MSRLLTTLLLYRSGYEIGKYISLEANAEVFLSERSTKLLVVIDICRKQVYYNK